MAGVETTITSAFDMFPILKKKPCKRYTTITIICTIYFLLTLTFTLQTGTYWIGNDLTYIYAYL